MIFGSEYSEIDSFDLTDANPQAYSEGTVGWVADYPRFRY